MISSKQAGQIAQEWIDAWNTHDIEGILSHYAENIELTSPVIVQLLGNGSGKIYGKEDLKAYFLKGLAAYPTLKFTLLEILLGINSIVLYYINQRGTHTAEYMEINSFGKIIKVIANYSITNEGQ